MKKYLSIIILSSLGSTSTFAARKIGCGVTVHEDFQVSRKVVQGKWYKGERSFRGNSTQDFRIVPVSQEAAYAVRFKIEHFNVRAEIENLKNNEVAEFDLGSIRPRDTVYGIKFSEEFVLPIEPIHFTDHLGKPQVIRKISGKCKLEKFDITNWLPIP